MSTIQSIKILIVDDNKNNLLALRTLIEQHIVNVQILSAQSFSVFFRVFPWQNIPFANHQKHKQVGNHVTPPYITDN
ncbi:MAG: hypothetical protein DRR16_22530 [Candidatus Parabeggiatoa sp. nov. 3]|nr:MAG: hypothetical protein DRR00_21165 [Gammaproteobacteria bacterium]RKZ63006.1 MAG: hypothetical protein DRQ99_17820 [Gammaproteobacteria bacterium]RKZ81203.1 MAG: hypothetical protein DRR16_22530 [Gammaproteobacteria bacterium]HEW98358.1 hypothetical protein [Beggiatoa sp.]